MLKVPAYAPFSRTSTRRLEGLPTAEQRTTNEFVFAGEVVAESTRSVTCSPLNNGKSNTEPGMDNLLANGGLTFTKRCRLAPFKTLARIGVGASRRRLSARQTVPLSNRLKISNRAERLLFKLGIVAGFRPVSQTGNRFLAQKNRRQWLLEPT